MVSIDYIGVWVEGDLSLLFPIVVDLGEDIPDTLQPGHLFIVGVYNNPGGVGGVGFGEHPLFVLGNLIPQLLGLHIDWGEFPLL